MVADWSFKTTAELFGSAQRSEADVDGPLAWLVALGYGLASVAVFDLVAWVLHYCQHRIPILWEFHKVHHSARVMHPLTNYREHPVDNALYAIGLGASTGLVAASVSALLDMCLQSPRCSEWGYSCSRATGWATTCDIRTSGCAGRDRSSTCLDPLRIIRCITATIRHTSTRTLRSCFLCGSHLRHLPGAADKCRREVRPQRSRGRGSHPAWGSTSPFRTSSACSSPSTEECCSARNLRIRKAHERPDSADDHPERHGRFQRLSTGIEPTPRRRSTW